MSGDMRCHFREGPYDDYWGTGFTPLPEHLRLYRCPGCDDIHADVEDEGGWPLGAARYSLAGMESDHLGAHGVYRWDGGTGIDAPCTTHKAQDLERELQPAAIGFEDWGPPETKGHR